MTVRPFKGMPVYYNRNLCIVTEIHTSTIEIVKLDEYEKGEVEEVIYPHSTVILPSTPESRPRFLTANQKGKIKDIVKSYFPNMEFKPFYYNPLSENWMPAVHHWGLLIPSGAVEYVLNKLNGTIKSMSSVELKLRNTDGRTICAACRTELKRPSSFQPEYNFCPNCES